MPPRVSHSPAVMSKDKKESHIESLINEIGGLQQLRDLQKRKKRLGKMRYASVGDLNDGQEESKGDLNQGDFSFVSSERADLQLPEITTRSQPHIRHGSQAILSSNRMSDKFGTETVSPNFDRDLSMTKGAASTAVSDIMNISKNMSNTNF